MEIIKTALSGFVTGIVLLGLIVFIFRKQEDNKRKKQK